MKEHPVNDMMGATMEKLKAMVDSNTVVGEPIVTQEVTIIPVSRVSFGFASGGSDFASKHQKPGEANAFGGGSGAGVHVDPIAFLVVREGTVRVLPLMPGPGGAIDRAINMVPDLVDKVTDFVEKQQDRKDNAVF